MSLISVPRAVYKIIDQTALPYTVPAGIQIEEISVCNDGADTVTLEIDTGEDKHRFNCTTYNRGYNARFDAIKTITKIAGTTFQIELRKV